MSPKNRGDLKEECLILGRKYRMQHTNECSVKYAIGRTGINVT